jgi:hypothetical protein
MTEQGSSTTGGDGDGTRRRASSIDSCQPELSMAVGVTELSFLRSSLSS